MVDYVKLAGVADRLVKANGRSVEFLREAETRADPLKPWEGPGDEATTPPTSVMLNSVFVPPNTVRQFGITALGQGTEFVDLVTWTEQIGIVFPEEYDMRTFTHLVDGDRYGITGLQVLKPGDIQLLAFIAVRR